MWDDYRRYLETPPREVVEWDDPKTEARGWLVINSLRGGAAGGGTRMRTGVTREEVTHLAKTMELKFSFSGPPIGGAKSGIDFDPADPRRTEVLERWFGAVRPYLATCYGTGGDMNVDEQRDVVPLCTAMGLRHPQEGVVRGHLELDDEAVERTFRRLREGIRAPVEDPVLGIPGGSLTVSDLVTGYGVARSAERLVSLRGGSLEGCRAIVEGFGNVGASCALYLARAGARIVGIVDARYGLAVPDGLGASEIESLLTGRRERTLPVHPARVEGSDREEVYAVGADLFVPAAASGTLDADRLEVLADAGVRTLVCGANQPFGETRESSTALQERADRDFEVVADAVASLGMARAFHALMTGEAEPEPEAIFRAVRRTVDEAVEEVAARRGTGSGGLFGAALGLALERIGS